MSFSPTGTSCCCLQLSFLFIFLVLFLSGCSSFLSTALFSFKAPPPFLSVSFPLPPQDGGRWCLGMIKRMNVRVCFTWPPHLSSFLPSSHPLCLSPGVVSQQDNGKTFSVSNTIQIAVERKDNGAALSCEAIHPALGGQKRIRHYRLDVYCTFLLQAVCLCVHFISKCFQSIYSTCKLFRPQCCHLSCDFNAIHYEVLL